MFKIFSKNQKKYCTAVVMAAGSSVRMGSDKLWMEIGGIPVLARTLSALENSELINEIIVVTREERIVDTARLCRDFGITKSTKVLIGGDTRLESALAGLSELGEKAELVLIHDAARPFVSKDIIERTIKAATLYKAAAPAIKPKDTVKINTADAGVSTLPRDSVFLVQTPQVFIPEIALAALSAAFQNGVTVTDDCGAVELMGIKIHLTEGDERNIKITTPLDIAIAEAILVYSEMV